MPTPTRGSDNLLSNSNSNSSSNNNNRNRHVRPRPRRRPHSSESTGSTNKRSSINEHEPPEWMLDEILDRIEESSRTDPNSDTTTTTAATKIYRWKLEDISEAKSAQQQVFVLKFSKEIRTNGSDSVHCGPTPKPNLRCHNNNINNINNINNNNNNNNNYGDWSDALRTGKGRLVLRIWRGGSRWWNLNRNENPADLARSEITGYEIARQALEDYRSEQRERHHKAGIGCTHHQEHQHHQHHQQHQQHQQHHDDDGAAVAIPRGPNARGAAAATVLPRMVPKIPRILSFHESVIEHHRVDDEPPSVEKNTGNTTLSRAVSSPGNTETLCWAVFEYVGADQNDTLTTENCCSSKSNSNSNSSNDDDDDDDDDDDAVKQECRYGAAKIDRSYLEGMIKVRREFGFDEPHPRWGRVPVDAALGYARIILHQVLLPLHRYSSRRLSPRRNQHPPPPPPLQSIPPNDDDDDDDNDERPVVDNDERPVVDDAKTFSGMVEVYRRARKDVSVATPMPQQHHKQHRNRDNDGGGGVDSSSSSSNSDGRIEVCLRRLDRGIGALDAVSSSDPSSIPALTPVLVHLDLQPQNIMFYSNRPLKDSDSKSLVADTNNNNNNNNNSNSEQEQEQQPSVFSVFDWEDAAWADPRFDLVLLCRKVCANREQADTIWSEYAEAIAWDGGQHCDACGTKHDATQSLQPRATATATAATRAEKNPVQQQQQQQQELGPIEPWLQLETVHSITTMLLQSVDLVNGGRNPWETKKDLWGKLQREFTRLNGYESSTGK